MDKTDRLVRVATGEPFGPSAFRTCGGNRIETTDVETNIVKKPQLTESTTTLRPKLVRRIVVAVPWFVIAAIGLATFAAQAQQNQRVPDLPATPFDYANPTIPSHLATGVAISDNTPIDNPVTDAGATLGRVLFYDVSLSVNDTTSCASCHVQENGFSDPRFRSVGFDGGTTARQSMGLSNAAFYGRGHFLWDERAATLEEQALLPIADPVEMGLSLDEMETKLAALDYYPDLFEDAFGTPDVTRERVAQALAQFIRSMVSTNSKFDRVQQGLESFTFEEQSGMFLFNAQCASCHDQQLHNIDAPRNNGINLDSTADPGVGNGEFKAPSLRNVAVTAPFMHDGRFDTLLEVVEFYNANINPNPNLSPELNMGDPNDPIPAMFGWTPRMNDEVVAFLNTLTDDEFLSAEKFSDPFVDGLDSTTTGFVPVTPCAVFDSRVGSAPIAGGATQRAQITGSVNQSGTACASAGAVPAGADAVMVNVVAIGPAGAGNLRVSAAGELAQGGVVNYGVGLGNNSNAVPVELSVDGGLDIFVNGGSTHVRLVVLGYYTDPAAPDALSFVPVTPCAVFDSRRIGVPIAGGATQTAQITGSVSQPGTPCALSGAVPSDADGVMVNLVAVTPTAGGNLKVSAAGEVAQGGVVNFDPKMGTNANAVPVELSPSGAIDIAVNGGATHVRAIVLGYYTNDAAAASASAFVPIAPCAVFDSRSDGVALTGASTTTAQITEAVSQPGTSCAASGAVPEGASAVMVNVVAVNPVAPGNLKISASGEQAQGGVVNFGPVGTSNANAVPVELSPSGQVDVFVNAAAGTATHVRLVVLGYYTE